MPRLSQEGEKRWPCGERNAKDEDVRDGKAIVVGDRDGSERSKGEALGEQHGGV